jgi:hypothetical protein
MLLKAVVDDVGHITKGRLYETTGLVNVNHEAFVIVFTDDRRWTAVHIEFFEPAIERSE